MVAGWKHPTNSSYIITDQPFAARLFGLYEPTWVLDIVQVVGSESAHLLSTQLCISSELQFLRSSLSTASQ